MRTYVVKAKLVGAIKNRHPDPGPHAGAAPWRQFVVTAETGSDAMDRATEFIESNTFDMYNRLVYEVREAAAQPGDIFEVT